MATAARGLGAVKVYLEMIKIEHSIFALPFALIGMMWGSISRSGHPFPGAQPLFWIVVAMVSCRSAAMAFNRMVDRKIDTENVRTASRALPSGTLKLSQSALFFGVSCALFAISAWQLNPLALSLSPVALGVTLFYSLTKRFTWLCHLILGLSLGIAPAAAWIGVTGSLHMAIIPLVMAVMFWTAGFDIIYALQDDDFDREHGLNSIPARFGRHRALIVSRSMHTLAVMMLILAGLLTYSGPFYFVGVVFAAALLIYEQSLVKPDDLSQVNMAFFTLNGYVSLGLFGFTLLDVIL